MFVNSCPSLFVPGNLLTIRPCLHIYEDNLCSAFLRIRPLVDNSAILAVMFLQSQGCPLQRGHKANEMKVSPYRGPLRILRQPVQKVGWRVCAAYLFLLLWSPSVPQGPGLFVQGGSALGENSFQSTCTS